jgi:polysaccharide deacetylase 2 family uncharacterized protein YibQ
MGAAIISPELRTVKAIVRRSGREWAFSLPRGRSWGEVAQFLRGLLDEGVEVVTVEDLLITSHERREN